MALFPKCNFQVLVPDGIVIPGTRVAGVLVLDAPENIPRAEHVSLDFISRAWVGYGSGKNRSVTRRTMFHAPLHIDLPQGMLAAGTHRFPFAVDVPPWLPPGISGNDCAIEHVIEARLDVDWAVDPVAKLTPHIMMRLGEATRQSLVTRSPASFDESIVLEITLASSVVAHDEPISGQIALRSGHSARFDAVDLTVAGLMTMTMARGDRRRGGGASIRIPAAALRSGEAVPFQFPGNQHLLLPTLRNSFIDYDVALHVSVDIPWASDPAFDILLHVLPAGSTIHGAGGGAVVGSERLRYIAAAMAQKTGLREGRSPTLVEGNVGPVSIRVSDAPRGAELGIDIDIGYPDVELGILLRPLGLLEGFRESPLLPAPLSTSYFLRAKAPAHKPHVDAEAAAQAFVTAALQNVVAMADVRFSDHHLGIHFRIQNDDLPRMVEIAAYAQHKAKQIADAIRLLPFQSWREPAERAAWEATAAEQSAVLVPTGPAIYGITMSARVLGGEVRTIVVAIRTIWEKVGPHANVEVDLRGAPIPKEAWPELLGKSRADRSAPLRAPFSEVRPLERGEGVTLVAGAVADPRELLPGIEHFFTWLLEARGERRVDAPYR